MTTYPSIRTLYLRDPATNYRTLIEGLYATPEFEYLANCKWEFTEKVDGTNVRIIIGEDGNVTFGGKTDDAQLPTPLFARLLERFGNNPRLAQSFLNGAVLYGEGYGPKIQKGECYNSSQDFVLFDIKVGRWWLERTAVEEVAYLFNLDVVPIIGTGTLPEMVEVCQQGFNSVWGDFPAEGIVARPTTELLTRAGDRIITKLKSKDFIHNRSN